MKRTNIITCLFLLTVLHYVSPQDKFPKLTGPYLGQKPPGMTPEIFAPGIISTKNDQNKIFFPSDGSEIIFWERDTSTNKMYIVSLTNYKGVWSDPKVLSFSRNYINMEPSLSPDGKKLFFVSNRPVGGNTEPEKTPDIWMVEKTKDDWTEPQNIGSPVNTNDIEVQPFYSFDNKLYFCRQAGNARGIYYSQFYEGKFLEPVKLDEKLTKGQTSGPCLSPDNQVLIVHSKDDGGFGSWDLYVSFKDVQGNWSELINLGNTVNTDDEESDATFSPDGKYLFFSRKGDIYWVDAKIIEDLRPKK